jgi:hypothetical protein
MEVFLIVTMLWQGELPPFTRKSLMPSMAECEKRAAEFRRRGGDMVTVECIEQL